MPACRLGPLTAALLLGLLLLGLPAVTGTGTEKPGVCPHLDEKAKCTSECKSDSECKDNLKCCQAGCAFICSMPNGNPGDRLGAGAGPRRAGRKPGDPGRSFPPRPAGGRGTVSSTLSERELGCSVEEKQGSCPQMNSSFPQLGLCQNQCDMDSQCETNMKCCRNGCGKMTCATPNF
uniref:WAP four-disulfide core domain protein 2 n=1 Tax=Otolemur garnettii TaxID=30611 RepID=H0XI70_OTOGA